MANCIRRKFVDVFDCAFDHSKARFPIMTMRAQKSGPRVFITGAIHGKETVGTEVINRIFKSVVLKRGTIYGIPAANMAGFIDGERRLPYGEPGMWDNLNSAFPGDSGGTPVERFAAAIYRTIILRKPDLVIDIHADSIHSIAFILLDRFIANPNPDLAAKTEALAKIFGITVCNDDTPDEYVHDGSQKTLTGALYNNAGIPAFVAELGGPILPDERFVQIGVNGIMNILDSMNMLKDPWRRVNAQKIEKPYPLRTQVIASDHASGKISYKITPGETVSRGQTIANIEDVFGKVVEVIEAPQHGIMLSLGYHPIAVPGVLIAIMAVRDKYK